MKNYAELIEALRYLAKVYSICENENTQEYQLAVQAADAIEKLTVAQPPLEEFEWCTDCKEYDQKNHFCHRFTKVIRQTVEELKAQQWIPVTERLPEPEKGTYWVCTDGGHQHECRWTNVNPIWTNLTTDWHWNIFDIPQYSRVVAWMPLPEPYKEGQE